MPNSQLFLKSGLKLHYKNSKMFAIIADMDFKRSVQVYWYWLISTVSTVFQDISSEVTLGMKIEFDLDFKL